ncbi:ribonuclease H-like domain-containing protein [Mycena crocata]|nr:ribonuclease H-like domain-containing protein [Mycena crocata]
MTDTTPDVVTPKLPLYPKLRNVIYIVSEQQANTELAVVTEGAVGFDTEHVKRVPTLEESIIDNLFKVTSEGGKKSAKLAWQVVELLWDNIGLCLVQIAWNDVVWVLNLNKIRKFPSELQRILCSANIAKAGVGLAGDVKVFWTDMRSNLMNLVDVGLMSKLLLSEKYPDGGFTNLSLQTSVAEILGYHIEKDYQEGTDWKGDFSSDSPEIQYAALDAVASLKLYEVLVPALARKAEMVSRRIPDDWYCFNSNLGETYRLTKSVTNSEVPWNAKDCPWFFSGKFQGYRIENKLGMNLVGGPSHIGESRPLLADRRRTYCLYYGLKFMSEGQHVWWQKEPPNHSSLDPNRYPRAWIFGQIIGEYVGIHQRYWEVAAPCFEEDTRLADLITHSFWTQLDHLRDFRRGQEEAMFEGPSRYDVRYGWIIRVPTMGRPAELLGQVVAVDLKLFPTPGTDIAKWKSIKLEIL